MKRNEKEAQRRQEDLALYRGIAWVGAALVIELFLMMVKRRYISFDTSQAGLRMANLLARVLPIVRLCAPLLGLGCLLWLWRERKGGKYGLLPLLLGLSLPVLGFACHLVLVYQDSGMRLLLLLIPALGGLGLAYYLYQKEFFWCGLFTGLGVVGLWMLRRRDSLTAKIYLLLMAVVLVCALGLLLYTRGGKALQLGKKRLRLLPPQAIWQSVALTLVLQLLIVCFAALSPSLAYYLIYVACGWLFGLLVYFTVKML